MGCERAREFRTTVLGVLIVVLTAAPLMGPSPVRAALVSADAAGGRASGLVPWAQPRVDRPPPPLPPPPSAEMTIMPLGDSITWGFQFDETPTGGYRSRLYSQLVGR